MEIQRIISEFQIFCFSHINLWNSRIIFVYPTLFSDFQTLFIQIQRLITEIQRLILKLIG